MVVETHNQLNNDSNSNCFSVHSTLEKTPRSNLFFPLSFIKLLFLVTEKGRIGGGLEPFLLHFFLLSVVPEEQLWVGVGEVPEAEEPPLRGQQKALLC